MRALLLYHAAAFHRGCLAHRHARRRSIADFDAVMLHLDYDAFDVSDRRALRIHFMRRNISVLAALAYCRAASRMPPTIPRLFQRQNSPPATAIARAVTPMLCAAIAPIRRIARRSIYRRRRRRVSLLRFGVSIARWRIDGLQGAYCCRFADFAISAAEAINDFSRFRLGALDVCYEAAVAVMAALRHSIFHYSR